MRKAAKRTKRFLRRFWSGIREWCGDAAYESYLRTRARHVSSGRMLSQAEFYVDQLNRRYSRPSRCC
jgi:uncharacterized short protein YbdD (DUF466 family)